MFHLGLIWIEDFESHDFQAAAKIGNSLKKLKVIDFIDKLEPDETISESLTGAIERPYSHGVKPNTADPSAMTEASFQNMITRST